MTPTLRTAPSSRFTHASTSSSAARLKASPTFSPSSPQIPPHASLRAHARSTGILLLIFLLFAGPGRSREHHLNACARTLPHIRRRLRLASSSHCVLQRRLRTLSVLFLGTAGRRAVMRSSGSPTVLVTQVQTQCPLALSGLGSPAARRHVWQCPNTREHCLDRPRRAVTQRIEANPRLGIAPHVLIYRVQDAYELTPSVANEYAALHTVLHWEKAYSLYRPR
ncbi:uncharacterized protein B0H18DRAFT_177934 [Fomitopsis serialis]|uniref:uncharacterized protein n=1 Tax=Fomitopsis serialis TaxID=139415 RepID=UPI002007BB12|nr:uncharacterized protein B0H18DRAFT_177934 [Neoantrodia serialis]KAH9913293.1 hypothetical protein B0H18DRAFT_177934 [Neoantrodia serialis]